jgi:hypothetical protein
MRCGCQQRKEIMFTDGGAGLTELVILGTAVILVIAAWRFTQ